VDAEWAAGLLSELAHHQTADPDTQRGLVRTTLSEFGEADTAYEVVVLHRVMKLLGTKPQLSVPGDSRFLSLADFLGSHLMVVVFSHHDLLRGTSRYLAFEQLRDLLASESGREPVVLGIGVDRTDSGARKARDLLADFGLDFPVWDRSTCATTAEWAANLGMTVTPWFLLLDEAGVVQRVAARPRPLVEES
jgi:hypothetical protein